MTDRPTTRLLPSRGEIGDKQPLPPFWATGAMRMALLLLLTFTITLSGCSSQTPGTTKKSEDGEVGTAVAVAVARRGDVSGALTFTGDVRARSVVMVVPMGGGQIERLYVDVGSHVKAGDVLAELDAAALKVQVRQAEAALAMAQAKLSGMEAGPRVEQVLQAEAGLDAARQKLTTMMNGSRAELIGQAEANLRAAEARLKQLKDGPTEEQRRAALKNIEGAKVRLNSARTQRDGDCGPVDITLPDGRVINLHPEPLCKGSEAGLVAAGYGVDAAQAQYDALAASPTAEQLTQAEAAVTAAREALKLAKSPFTEQDVAQVASAVRAAEQQLKMAQSPFTVQDMELMRAQVAQAKAALDLVRYQADQTQIVAPVNGVISERFLAQGAVAGPSTPIVSLIGDALEVVFTADERQIGSLAVGMPVSLTVSAFAGETFAGAISSVSPTVDPKTRTFTLKVKPNSEKLKAGMLARLKVTNKERQGATLVPKEAIVQRAGKAVLFVVDQGHAKLIEAATGLADDNSVEILQGLAPGSQVVISGHAELSDNDPVRVVSQKTGESQ